MSFIFRFQKYLAVAILTEWLSAKDVVHLSCAVCKNHLELFEGWLHQFSSLCSKNIFFRDCCLTSSYKLFKWCKKFNLDTSQLLCHLKKICYKLSNIAVCEKEEYLLSIKRLEMSNYASNLEILQQMNNLEEVNFMCAIEGVIAVARNCQHLRVCEINCGGLLTDQYFIEICRNCPVLTSLTVYINNNKFGRAAMHTIVVHARKLQVLHLQGAPFVNYEMLLFILHCKAPLTTLKLPQLPAKSMLPYLGGNIEYLSLPLLTTNIEAHLVSKMCPNLIELSIDYRVEEWPESLISEVISGLHHLQVFKIEEYNLLLNSNDILQLATHCTELRTLRTWGLVEPLSSEALNAFANNLTNLTVLSLWESNLTDDQVSRIAESCTNLTDLNISFNRELTDAPFVTLAFKCKQLRMLEASETLITDFGLRMLADNCKWLWLVYISGCTEVTDSGVEYLLANLPITNFDYKQED